MTTKAGEYVDFTFSGRGIAILSEKYHDMGNVEVLLDGVSQGTFSLYQDPMPRLYQVEFYRNMKLSGGTHRVRVVNKGPEDKFCLIDGFRVYGGIDRAAENPVSLKLLLNKMIDRDALAGAGLPLQRVYQLRRKNSRGT